MTWSSSLPRAVPREVAERSPTQPVAWSPVELALDTRPLHDALQRPDVVERPFEVAATPAPELMERALQDAYERGYEDGRSAGALAEDSRLRGAARMLAEALAKVQSDGDMWVGHAEANVSALAIAVARQVIGREVALDKSTLAAMVRQALDEFPLDQPLTLRVNALDLHAIQSSFHALGETSPLVSRKDVQWLPDSRIAVGGCLIEGRDRIVDGRVDTALERLYRRLADTRA